VAKFLIADDHPLYREAYISAVFRKFNVNTRTQTVLLLKNLDIAE